MIYPLFMEITALDAADFYRVLDERQEPSVVYFTTPGCEVPVGGYPKYCAMVN